MTFKLRVATALLWLSTLVVPVLLLGVRGAPWVNLLGLCAALTWGMLASWLLLQVAVADRRARAAAQDELQAARERRAAALSGVPLGVEEPPDAA